MTTYRVTIQADCYPTDYTVTATGWPAAIARAVRAWKKSRVGKGARTTELRIHAVKTINLKAE
jgi:hypothetical protein